MRKLPGNVTMARSTSQRATPTFAPRCSAGSKPVRQPYGRPASPATMDRALRRCILRWSALLAPHA
ncbi:hypothetical protein [Mycoavidus cysteinexigens]|uniref:hypothetical protein n=1 Tax=Mycoavidus cysteinexigens TaxID=1553431 RepID=UPI0028BE37C3|nr:hypothetical protein [Mycoavidus cysteinexigens]